jgi:uncharacterized coiled-coil DUF342 family protein
MPRRDREKLDQQPLRLGPIRNADEVSRCLRRLLKIRATLRLDRERYRDLIDGLKALHEVYRAQEEAKAHADLLAALPQLEQRKKEMQAHVMRLVRGGKPPPGAFTATDGEAA